ASSSDPPLLTFHNVKISDEFCQTACKIAFGGKEIPPREQQAATCSARCGWTDRGVDQMKRFVLGLMAATAMTATAWAQEDIQPGLLFDLGGKFDKSFNEASFNGAEQFKNESGISYVEFEISNDAQREQALRRFAEDGRNPIVMAGFSWSSALEI